MMAELNKNKDEKENLEIQLKELESEKNQL